MSVKRQLTVAKEKYNSYLALWAVNFRSHILHSTELAALVYILSYNIPAVGNIARNVEDEIGTGTSYTDTDKGPWNASQCKKDIRTGATHKEKQNNHMDLDCFCPVTMVYCVHCID